MATSAKNGYVAIVIAQWIAMRSVLGQVARILSAASRMAYNLANFMRTLALPKEVEHWSLTTLREKLVKIGAKVVSHGRYVTFQLAEVAVPRELFRKILRLIAGLRPAPLPP